MSQLIEQEHLDKSKIVLMTQDEGRFGRVNIPRSCWAPKQVRPLVAKQVVRENFYVYAGICPKLGRISSLILPYANTEMMNLFLENVSDEFKEFEIIMQLDGAGWHKAKGLRVPSNIHFIQQPSYSPEVNPTEHLWDELREKYLHNKIFNSIPETMEIICKGINELNAKPDYVKSMTSFPYLNISF